MKVPIKGLGDVGYVPDQDGYELALNAITDLQNMRMRNGWAERVRGHRQVGEDLMSPPYALAPFAANETKYVLEIGLRDIFVEDGSTRTDVSYAAGLTMNAGHKWTGDSFNGYHVLNNQADIPISWNGSLSSPFVALTGWDTGHRAKALRAMQYHLVALNMTENGVSYPHRLRVSAAATPGSLPASWNKDDATIDADAFDVTGDGVLVDGILMGETLIIYKERSVSAMRYAPSNTGAFSVDPLPFRFGMLSQNCGVNVPGIGHVVLTQGDVVRFDGNSVDSIVEGRAREWLFSQIDENHFKNCFIALNERRSEVLICFPERGYEACTKALVWNYRNDKLSKRDLPNVTCACSAVLYYAVDTFDDDSATFDSESVLTFDSGSESVATNDTRLLMGTTGSELLIMDSGDTANGSNFTSYIERTGLNDIGGLEDRVKHFKRLHLKVDAAAGTQLSVSFGASMNAETAPTYASAVTFTVGTDEWVDAWATGIYLAYKISATGDDFWRARTVTPEVLDAGAY